MDFGRHGARVLEVSVCLCVMSRMCTFLTGGYSPRLIPQQEQPTHEKYADECCGSGTTAHGPRAGVGVEVIQGKPAQL